MTFEKIIEIADKVYPGFIGLYAADNDSDYGDTLALFIARELKDTYDPDASDYAQLEEAAQAMRSAARELSYVLDAFETGWDHLKKETN